jgi:hypothetical protein
LDHLNLDQLIEKDVANFDVLMAVLLARYRVFIGNAFRNFGGFS